MAGIVTRRLRRSALFTVLAIALVLVVASPANAYTTYQGYSYRTYINQATVRTGPVGNSGCSYAVSTWVNPGTFPGTGVRVWCSGARLIKMQHALYWNGPSSSLYMASPQWSYGTVSDTGEWGYVNVSCANTGTTWQWQPAVYIWINNQYMGGFFGYSGGFEACVG